MASDRPLRTAAACLGLVTCGIVMATACRLGYWGLLAGALLAAGWITALSCSRPRGVVQPAGEAMPAPPPLASRLLLDAAPTPMLAVQGGAARALNRAARRLFATDDRLRPVPAELLDDSASHLRHEGRSWRIDRVMLDDGMVAALVDIEREERAAEARASAELIQVLGHELLNGLAPIASLAESGVAAVAQPTTDPALLPDILSTLARRAESLQRFAEAYRSLARLPAPVLREEPVAPILGDLARMFTGRWPGIELRVDLPSDLTWPMDRDQISQALWALLQNAAEALAGRSDGQVVLQAHRTGTRLDIDVVDNGPGVSPDTARRIFRPFHTTKPGGTGIGLSLARQIAQAHGGRLTLGDSAPTLFRLSLCL